MIRQERKRRPPKATARLLTLESIRDEYGPPTNSLRDLINRGVLPIVRFPGSRRIWIERAEVERLIAASRETR